MSEETLQIMKSEKCARIIINISEMFGVSLQEATDIYYNSEIANLIEEGIADLHCRSDKYLAEEVWKEYQEKPEISKDFTIDDIHKIREYNYEETKNLTVAEQAAYYKAKAEAFLKEAGITQKSKSSD